MKIRTTDIQDCYIIEPRVFQDDRGYFFESFNLRSFTEQTGIEPDFVQDNQSLSSRGVLRGFHYQSGDHAQAKLVRVLRGEVLDLAVDLRKHSPTYGNVVSMVLSDANFQQLYIPRGCAHAFLTLKDDTLFFYKCDNYYNKASEGGIRFDDPELAIDWPIPTEELIISEKDRLLPLLSELKQEI